jgi:hypothetical protein
MEKVSNFVKKEVLKLERNSFVVRILVIVALYTGITFWLNSIRATAAIWFVWVLIIVQLLLYFGIFVSCYSRASVIGLNKNLGFVLFLILAVLGRMNDWELVVIPLMVIIMIILSFQAKNISDEYKNKIGIGL